MNKHAYNGVASWTSLKTSDYATCCYIKVKLKNKEADEKFTHRGYIEITTEEYGNDVKNL